MLSDAQIERWSRQILLPEVGGRGQERLLSARVGLAGDGPAAAHAVDLLARAGVRVSAGAPPDGAAVLIDLAGAPPTRDALARRALDLRATLVRGRVAGAAGGVWTLTRRPCGLCAPEAPPRPRPWLALEGAAARAVGALVAAETIGAILVPPRAGRRQALDLAGGEFTGGPLRGPGCPLCAEPG